MAFLLPADPIPDVESYFRAGGGAGLEAAMALGPAGTIDEIGPDEYLFGEEKALLEVIEGRDPLPRALPPYEHGLFATVPIGWEDGDGTSAGWESNATAVNNVETLATAAHILARGATWYRTMGTPASPGTLLATVVGDVVHPRVVEVEMGTPFDELLALCGGPRDGRRFVAAFSGVSNRVLRAADFDVRLTYEDLADRGTGLGAAGFVVYDDSADLLSVAREFSRFLAVESCGQCPPCKTGSMDITDRLLAIEVGNGSERDLAVIAARLRTVTDANRCFLGTEERYVVSSVLEAFPEALVARLNGTAGPLRPALIPLVKDIDENGVVTYDERHALKQPDWTYLDAATRR